MAGVAAANGCGDNAAGVASVVGVVLADFEVAVATRVATEAATAAASSHAICVNDKLTRLDAADEVTVTRM